MSLAPSEVSDADRALDTIAVLLRAFGEHAFDVAEATRDAVRESCDDWASRVLVGDRDLPGLRQWFAAHRRDEAEWVSTTFADLRETVRAFSKCVATVVGSDRASDAELGERVAALGAALESSDPDLLRREAEATVSTASRVFAEREARLQAELDELRARVAASERALEESRGDLEHDALTQLFSPDALAKHVERLADVGLLFESPPSLILVDLDGFGAIDERVGRPASDDLLKRVANRLLRSFLRKEDFVARAGPDEFAIVVAERDLNATAELADRALEAVRRESAAGLPVQASVGVGQLESGEPGSTWRERATKALDAARRTGGGRVVVSEPPAAPAEWKAP